MSHIYAIISLRTAEIEGDLSRFNASEICMAFRYHLKDTMMQRKQVPFINENLDVSTDFEGDLRYVEFCVILDFYISSYIQWKVLSRKSNPYGRAKLA